MYCCTTMVLIKIMVQSTSTKCTPWVPGTKCVRKQTYFSNKNVYTPCVHYKKQKRVKSTLCATVPRDTYM